MSLSLIEVLTSCSISPILSNPLFTAPSALLLAYSYLDESAHRKARPSVGSKLTLGQSDGVNNDNNEHD